MARNLLPLHRKDASPRHANGHIPDRRHARTNGDTSAAQQEASRFGVTNKWRNELVAAAAEFAGTFMFLFFAFGGTQVANSAAVASNARTAGQNNNGITQAPDTSVLLYISLIFGFSLMVNVWVFFRVSGGLFNPAVSFPLGPNLPIRCNIPCTCKQTCQQTWIGHFRSLHGRRPHSNSRYPLLYLPDARRHVRRSRRLRHPPGSPQCQYQPRFRRIPRPGCLP